MKKLFTLTLLAVMFSIASFAVGPITGTKSLCTGSSSTLADTSIGGVWSSTVTAVAYVGSSTGIVYGISPGTSLISYTISGISAFVTVTVYPTPAAISGPSTVCKGSTITLSDATAGGTWMSGNTAIASAGITSGVITGVSNGVVNIYYSISGCGALKTVTVTGPSVITGPSSVCAGSSITLTDSTSGGTWSTSGTAASVTSGGVVTGLAFGVVNIYYLVGGCGAFHSVTVMPAPSAIGGPSSVCVGSSITLTDATSGGSWTSGNTVIATANPTSGSITGVAGGTATITYKLSSGCYATKIITVTTLTTPISGSATVCIGSTITLSDATPGGSWLSGNTAIANVSSAGVVTGVSGGVVNIYYSVGGCGASKTVTVIPGSVITGPSSVCVGGIITLVDTVSGGTWSAGGTAASVSSGGVVTGLASGVVNIYYLVGGCGAYHTVTVMPAPSSIGGPSTVCVGSTITLTDATSGGTWSSGNTSVATANPTSGSITGVAAGTATITYKLSSGCYATKVITVTTLTTPISGSSTVCIGSTLTLSDATPGGSWLSGNTSIATVSSTGVVTGVAGGVVNIYYSVGGCGASKTVTVISGSTITGPSTVCIGGTITLVDTVSGGSWTAGGTALSVSSGGVVTGLVVGVANVYYIVGGCGAYHTVTVTPGPSSIGGPSTVCIGSTITLTDATTGGTWSSSSSAIATVGISTGVVTGVSAGTVTITYKLTTGCFVTKTVTITSLTTPITGGSTTCVGSTLTLSDATPGGSWLSGNTSIATVSSGGVVTGVAAGVVNIYYSVSGCGAYKTVTIITAPKPITGPHTVCAGSTISLTDSIGGGSWLSSNTSIATVGTTGVVTGVAPGVVNIYYVVGTCGAYYSVTVTGSSVITGPSTVCVGSTITLSDATTGGTWSSGNTSIATVSSGGIVTGASAGVVNIYYTVGGCSASKTVTVVAAPKPITGLKTVCVGSSITLSDSTGGGSWLSGNTAIATVSSGGVVTGISAGVVNIYYALGSCGAYMTVTVTGSSVITGGSTLCVGASLTLSDATSGGTWSSSSTPIATV
ncbi:MAG: surface protein, partial [Flavipsychrobacter sp.]|nr:surface protein [Flavipsychrobacter sp.]